MKQLNVYGSGLRRWARGFLVLLAALGLSLSASGVGNDPSSATYGNEFSFTGWHWYGEESWEGRHIFSTNFDPRGNTSLTAGDTVVVRVIGPMSRPHPGLFSTTVIRPNGTSFSLSFTNDSHSRGIRATFTASDSGEYRITEWYGYSAQAHVGVAPSNVPPTASIASSTSGGMLFSGASGRTIQVSAADSDGNLDRIEVQGRTRSSSGSSWSPYLSGMFIQDLVNASGSSHSAHVNLYLSGSAGTQYQYRVRAVDTEGATSSWAESNVFTLQDRGLTASINSSTSGGTLYRDVTGRTIGVSATDNAGNLNRIEVQSRYRLTSGNSWDSWRTTYVNSSSINASGSSHSANVGLNLSGRGRAGSQYQYRVRAVAGDGASSNWVESNVFSLGNRAPAITSHPTNPNWDNLSAGESRSFSLSATDPDYNLRRLEYRVRRAPLGTSSFGAWESIVSSTDSGLGTVNRSASFTYTFDAAGTRYQFQARARDHSGSLSSWSSAWEGATDAEDNPPEVSVNLQTAPFTNDKTHTWSITVSDVDGDLAEIRRWYEYREPGGNWTTGHTWSTITNPPGGGASYSWSTSLIQNHSPGTQIQYIVEARDSWGNRVDNEDEDIYTIINRSPSASFGTASGTFFRDASNVSVSASATDPDRNLDRIEAQVRYRYNPSSTWGSWSSATSYLPDGNSRSVSGGSGSASFPVRLDGRGTHGSEYQLRVRAVDESGAASGWSTSGTYSVGNRAPTLTFTATSSNRTINRNDTVSFNVNSHDPDFNADRVDVQVSADGGAWRDIETLTGTRWGVNTTMSYSDFEPGSSYRFRARARDLGHVSTGAGVMFSPWVQISGSYVVEDNPPTVNLSLQTSPFTNDRNHTWSVSASDADGDLVRIERWYTYQEPGASSSTVAEPWSDLTFTQRASYSTSWTTSLIRDYPPGTVIEMFVRAVDASGNETTASTTDTIQNRNPSVAIGSPDGPLYRNGTVSVGATASDPDGNLDRIEAQVSYRYSPTQSWGSWSSSTGYLPQGNSAAVSGGSGSANFTINLSGRGTFGSEYRMRVRAVDEAGAASSWISSPTLVVDNRPPTLTFSATSSNRNVAVGDSVTFNVEAEDPDSRFDRVVLQVSVNSGSWTTFDSVTGDTWGVDTTASYSDFQAGASYRFRARAQDHGHVSSGANVMYSSWEQISGSYTVASNAPAISLTLTSEPFTNYKNHNWLVEASDVDGDLVQVERWYTYQEPGDSSPTAVSPWAATTFSERESYSTSWTTNVVRPYPPGTIIELFARAIDGAGNETTTSSSHTVINRNPSVTIGSPDGPLYRDGTVSVGATASDPDGNLDRIEAQVGYRNSSSDSWSSWSSSSAYLPNGGSVSASGSSDSGSFLIDLSNRGTYGSQYRMRVRAVDEAGGTSSWATSSAMEVQNRAPTLSFTANSSGRDVQRGDTATFNVEASDPDDGFDRVVVQVSVNNGSWATFETVIGNTAGVNTTVDYSDFQPGASYRFRARAQDQGHVVTGANVMYSSWEQISGSYEVESRPPTVTISLETSPFINEGSHALIATASDPDEDLVELERWYSFQRPGDSSPEIRTPWASDTFSERADYTRSWSTGVVQNLPPGTVVEFFAKAIDSTGNEATASTTHTVINRNPSVTIGSPDGPLYRNGSVSIGATASDPDGNLDRIQAQVSYRYSSSDSWSSWSASTANVASTNPVSVSGATGEADFALGLANRGTHGSQYRMRVRAVDESGAASSWATSAVMTVENRPPTVNISTSGPASVSEGGSFPLSVSATDPDNNLDRIVIQYRVNSGSWQAVETVTGSGSSMSETVAFQNFSVPGGIYQFRSQSHDSGNVNDGSGALSSGWQVLSDTVTYNTPPRITFIELETEPFYNDELHQWRVEVSDDAGNLERIDASLIRGAGETVASWTRNISGSSNTQTFTLTSSLLDSISGTGALPGIDSFRFAVEVVDAVGETDEGEIVHGVENRSPTAVLGSVALDSVPFGTQSSTTVVGWDPDHNMAGAQIRTRLHSEEPSAAEGVASYSLSDRVETAEIAVDMDFSHPPGTIKRYEIRFFDHSGAYSDWQVFYQAIIEPLPYHQLPVRVVHQAVAPDGNIWFTASPPQETVMQGNFDWNYGD